LGNLESGAELLYADAALTNNIGCHLARLPSLATRPNQTRLGQRRWKHVVDRKETGSSEQSLRSD